MRAELKSDPEVEPITGVETSNNAAPIDILVNTLEDSRLSDVRLDTLIFGNVTLKVSPPLILTPIVDDTSDLCLIAEDSEFGLYVAAQTREELISEISENLIAAWEVIAKADPDELDPTAAALREVLLSRLEPVNAVRYGSHV